MQSTIFLTKGLCNRLAVILAAVILLGSCNKDKKPEGVLSETRLAGLLVEIYIDEAKLNSFVAARDSMEKIFAPMEQMIMDKEKISRKELKDTYRYYLEHPVAFERVYDIVLDSLAVRENRLQKLTK